MFARSLAPHPYRHLYVSGLEEGYAYLWQFGKEVSKGGYMPATPDTADLQARFIPGRTGGQMGPSLARPSRLVEQSAASEATMRRTLSHSVSHLRLHGNYHGMANAFSISQ